MSTVGELLPGDLVIQVDGSSAIFIARTEHPIWPTLKLVVWKLDDGTWSHDALLAHQDVGKVFLSDDKLRQTRLRGALLGARR